MKGVFIPATVTFLAIVAFIAFRAAPTRAAPPVETRTQLPVEAFDWDLEHDSEGGPSESQNLRCPLNDLTVAALTLRHPTTLLKLLDGPCIEPNERDAVVQALKKRADWPDPALAPATLTSWFWAELVAPASPDGDNSRVQPETYIVSYRSPGSRAACSEVVNISYAEAPLVPQACRNAASLGVRVGAGVGPWHGGPDVDPPSPLGPRIALGSWYGSARMRAGLELALSTTTRLVSEEADARIMRHEPAVQLNSYVRTELWPGPLMIASELLVGFSPSQQPHLMTELAVTLSTHHSPFGLRLGIQGSPQELRAGFTPGLTLTAVFDPTLWIRSSPDLRSLAGARR